MGCMSTKIEEDDFLPLLSSADAIYQQGHSFLLAAALTKGKYSASASPHCTAAKY